MTSNNLAGGSIKNKITNPDLIEERAKCTFNQKEMEWFFFDKEVVQMTDDLLEDQKKHPELLADTTFRWYDLTRQEKQEVWLKRYNILSSINRDKYINNIQIVKNWMWAYFYQGFSPLHLHHTMFRKTIENLGSEKQVAELIPQVLNLSMIGCYAQTELGHGSDVSRLETTATFDNDAQEWVIHTPHVRATKFWPGSMGLMANYAMVFARAITAGNDNGVQPFLVQIRSKEDHMPLPGVEVGDIGNKMGYGTIDNGYLSFNQVRIPRKQMMMRFLHIKKDGSLELRGDPRLIYQIMVNTRMIILGSCGSILYRSLLIATRYAVCRRQFSSISGTKEERKLIDYQTHLNLIGSQLSNVCVLQSVQGFLLALQAESDELLKDENFKMLDVLHHFTSGIKAIGTDVAYKGMDELRQACGGAGFSLASGMVEQWGDFAPSPTYEGVNVVMAQQSARYVLKQYRKHQQGKKTSGLFSYINDIEKNCELVSQAQNVKEFSQIEHLDLAMRINASAQLSRTCQLWDESDASTKQKENEIFAMDIQRLTRLHIKYAMFLMTRDRLRTTEFNCPNIRPILELLNRIYAIKEIQADNQLLYETGFFGKGSVKLMNDSMETLLLELRPHLIPIVEMVGLEKEDSWNLSTIGNKYGDIYEAQLDVAKNSRLNTGKPPPYYEKLMKPLFNGGHAKL